VFDGVARLMTLTSVISWAARRSFRPCCRWADLEGIVAVMAVAKSKLLRRVVRSFMMKVTKWMKRFLEREKFLVIKPLEAVVDEDNDLHNGELTSIYRFFMLRDGHQSHIARSHEQFAESSARRLAQACSDSLENLRRR